MRRVLGCTAAQPAAGGGSKRPAGADLALAAGGRRDRRNTIDVECQSNGQGWHNRLLTKRTPSSILFYI